MQNNVIRYARSLQSDYLVFSSVSLGGLITLAG